MHENLRLLRHRLMDGPGVAALLKALSHARAVHESVAQQAQILVHSQQSLWVAAGLVVLAGAVQGLLTGFGGYQGELVSQKVAYRLRLDYFQHLQRLSFRFHDNIHSGDLITRGMIDLEGTRAFVQNGMMQSLTLVLLLVVATTMMFLADLVMALLALAFVPISIYTLGRVAFMLRIAMIRLQNLMIVLTMVME